MSVEPVLLARSLVKRYGRVTALDHADFDLFPGEILAVIGDNGAGKSTLIKIIAGLHQHDEGSFKIMGEERKLGSPREALDAGIAAVYQDLAVVSLMPIWRNFFLGSELTTGVGPFKRMDVQKMKDITKKELADMGIDLRDVEQPIGQLSGGERQRVALARAFLANAPVLILDEATSSLDSESEALIQEAMHRLIEGRTAIVIAHRLSTVRMLDRILVFEHGRVVEEGRHEALVRKTEGIYKRLFERQALGLFVEDPMEEEANMDEAEELSA